MAENQGRAPVGSSERVVVTGTRTETRPIGAVGHQHDAPEAFMRDRVRWGPIWAGLLTALTSLLLLGVPIILWLASQGLGAILGSLGSFGSGLRVDPSQAQSAAEQARQAAGTVQPIDAAQAAEQARNAGWAALLGSLLGLGASALGGFLGTRREREMDRATGRVTA